LEQPSHDQVRVGACRQMVDLCNDAQERRFHSLDGLRGEIITLRLQAPMVLLKFFAVKIDQR